MIDNDLILRVLWFIILGFIGGFGSVLVNSDSWDDLRKYEAFRKYMIGAFVGFLYFYAYSDHNFPNALMCCLAGYSGTDFIQKLIERTQPKQPPG